MKKKILQINECLSGSTGSIARQIGDMAISFGWDSWIAYSAFEKEIPCKSQLIKIGNKIDYLLHALETRLLDNHGFSSKKATNTLIKRIESLSPDVIHLHNIHGYYLNFKLLFDYLQQSSIPVIWTMHDCWPFTGHCALFNHVNCQKWQDGCYKCSETRDYPKAYFDRSKRNWKAKKDAFMKVKNLTIVTVSDWLASTVEKSFLGRRNIVVIKNGIDVERFVPSDSTSVKRKFGLVGKKVLIAVSVVWDYRKGLNDYMKLSKHLYERYVIVLVGLTEKQISSLPPGIIGVKKTENVEQLVALYNMADVVLSLSYGETFGMTIAEGMACGKPAIVYDNTALPELITSDTGRIVKTGDFKSILNALNDIEKIDTMRLASNCRNRAERFFNKNERFEQYIRLYDSAVGL